MKSIFEIWKTAILWKYAERRRWTDICCEEGRPSDYLFSSGKGWHRAEKGKHVRNQEVWVFMAKDLQHVSACEMHFPFTSRQKFLWRKFNWKMSHAYWQVLAHKLILSSNQNRVTLRTIKTNGEVEVFASCERKKVTVDGKVQDCQFRQLMGICMESESVMWCPDKFHQDLH